MKKIRKSDLIALCITFLIMLILILISIWVINKSEVFEDEEVEVVQIIGEPIPTKDIETLSAETKNEIEPIDMEEVYRHGYSTIRDLYALLTRYKTPDEFYENIDYNTMQPYMSYNAITDTTSQAYEITHSENAYTDDLGYRRYKVSDEQFSIDGNDDYIIALGTYYKEKGTCGDRWLIITTTGMYTAITGDEKADKDTDELHMVHKHTDGRYSLIEWIVDTNKLESLVKAMGSVRYSSVAAMNGDILYMYKITELKDD